MVKGIGRFEKLISFFAKILQPLVYKIFYSSFIFLLSLCGIGVQTIFLKNKEMTSSGIARITNKGQRIEEAIFVNTLTFGIRLRSAKYNTNETNMASAEEVRMPLPMVFKYRKISRSES